MTTAYTAGIEKGEVTELDQFAMVCARAFMPLLAMRDMPMSATVPEEIKPRTDYADERLAEMEERVQALEAMSPLAIKAAALDDYTQRLKTVEKIRSERRALRHRFETMLEKVEAWHPPADYNELKGLMRKQLLQAIEFDCDEDFLTDPPMVSPEDWWARELAEARNMVIYYTKSRDEEIERARSSTEWIKGLRASLAEL